MCVWFHGRTGPLHKLLQLSQGQLGQDGFKQVPFSSNALELLRGRDHCVGPCDPHQFFRVEQLCPICNDCNLAPLEFGASKLGCLDVRDHKAECRRPADALVSLCVRQFIWEHGRCPAQDGFRQG